MKRSVIIGAIVLIVLLIIGGFYFYKPNSPKIEQECIEEKGYCVYNNVPKGMKYSEPPYWIKEDSPQPPLIDDENFILMYDTSWGYLLSEGLITKDEIPPHINISNIESMYGEIAWEFLLEKSEGKITKEDIPPRINYGELQEYLMRDDSSKELGEAFGGEWDKYKCSNTKKIPVIIEYFYDLCEGFEGMQGCGHKRGATVCGDIYFVEDFTSSYGPRLYGPFNFKS